MMNALRLRDGVDAALFKQRTGLPLSSIGNQLSSAMEEGLLVNDTHRIQTTDMGYRFLDSVLARFS